MLISMLSVLLMGAPDCANGRCQSPIIRIRVPGVRVDIGQPFVRRVVPSPVRSRGWFGKWKYKAKYKAKYRGRFLGR